MIEYTTYKLRDADQITVLELTGRLDSESSEFLLDTIQGMVEDGVQHIVLDCQELQFVSSIGLATLVRANSRLKQKSGTVALANVHSMIADVLHVVHFDRLFHMFDSVEAAAESMR